MTINMNGGRLIALLVLSLILGLAGADAYAQDAVLLSQDLTSWADSASLQAILADKAFTSAEELYPISRQEEILGLGITGSVELKGANSLVRVILIDNQLNEYLAYEAYPLVSPNGSFSISNACRETCVLPRSVPSALKIELINAAIQIQSVVVNPATQVQARTLAVPTNEAEQADELKEAQEAEIIELLNMQIKAKGLKWRAGETSVSRLSFEEKKALFGGETLPNLQGFEYYKGGIFELDPGAVTPSELESDSSVIDAFDWRNKHAANDPNSPYYDGDPTGSGWITSVKNQRACGSCWAFCAVGATEALANLFYNQHLDLNLSEQHMLSCAGCGSCSGGVPVCTLSYITSSGVIDEACFPYSATDEACSNLCGAPNELIRIAGLERLYPSNMTNDELKLRLINDGPLSFGIRSWSHCIVLVGYDTDPGDGEPIWIIKNSWGTGWGENGYGKMKVPLYDIYLTSALWTPVTSDINLYRIACLDEDGDNYYNWGIADEAPENCGGGLPLEIKDCDDSDPDVALLRDDGSCGVPVIDIETLTNGIQADGANDPDVPRIAPGGPVTWTYQVNNSSEVVFSEAEIVVTDNQMGVTPLLDVATDDGDGFLSPGETWNYTASAQALDLETASDFTVTPGCNDNRPTYENIGTVAVPGASDSDPSHYCNTTPANNAPTIGGTPATSVSQDTTYSFTPISGDIDGDILLFSVINKPTWATFETTTGTLTGIPSNADVGTTSGIVITVDDQQGQPNSIASLPSFNLTVINVNDAPTIGGTPATSVSQDTTYSFTPISGDIDGDILLFSVINKPTWATFETTTGTLTGIPSNADVGTTSGIVITVDDQQGQPNSIASLPSFNLTVINVNDAPTIGGTPATSVSQDTTYSFTPISGDIDGDILLFSVINKPTWATFETTTGTLTGIPSNADVGTTSGIVITVDDQQGQPNSIASLPSFNLTVINVNDAREAAIIELLNMQAAFRKKTEQEEKED